MRNNNDDSVNYTMANIVDAWAQEWNARCNSAESSVAPDSTLSDLHSEILELKKQRALILAAARASIDDAWEQGWEAGYECADRGDNPYRTVEEILEAFDKSVNSCNTVRPEHKPH